MLGPVAEKIDAIEDATARKWLHKCVPVAEKLIADWRCRVAPGEFLVVAATPKGGLVTVAEDWPTLDENNPFYAAQREHDSSAAALIAAIESMEGDLALGGLWVFAKGNPTLVQDRTRIAGRGKVPLVVALVAYEDDVLMQFVAISEMPAGYMIAVH